jgi:hypothetical protein
MDADRWREEADCERNHARALFEHDMDLSSRLERLHRERLAEVARAEVARAN